MTNWDVPGRYCPCTCRSWWSTGPPQSRWTRCRCSSPPPWSRTLGKLEIKNIQVGKFSEYLQKVWPFYKFGAWKSVARRSWTTSSLSIHDLRIVSGWCQEGNASSRTTNEIKHVQLNKHSVGQNLPRSGKGCCIAIRLETQHRCYGTPEIRPREADPRIPPTTKTVLTCSAKAIKKPIRPPSINSYLLYHLVKDSCPKKSPSSYHQIDWWPLITYRCSRPRSHWRRSRRCPRPGWCTRRRCSRSRSWTRSRRRGRSGIYRKKQ